MFDIRALFIFPAIKSFYVYASIRLTVCLIISTVVGGAYSNGGKFLI